MPEKSSETVEQKTAETPVANPYPLIWCTLNILGTTWTVILSDEATTEAIKECEGYCDLKPAIIYIDRELPDARKLDVLTHEILHAVIFMSGADKMFEHLFGSSKLPWEEREEILISTFGVNLHDTLMRNGFIKYPDIPEIARVPARTA